MTHGTSTLLVMLIALIFLPGCLADEEETLGTAPTAAGIFFDFESGGVPAVFTQIQTGSAPIFTNVTDPISCDGNMCLYSGIISGVGVSSCVEYNEAVATSQVSFLFTYTSTGGGQFFGLQVDGGTLFTYSGPYVSLMSVSMSAGAGGQHAYRWCMNSDAVSTGVLWIDDL